MIFGEKIYKLTMVYGDEGDYANGTGYLSGAVNHAYIDGRTYAPKGTTIFINTTPDDGYTDSRWFLNGTIYGNDRRIFDMPDQDTIVSADFEFPFYTVQFEVENDYGSIKFNGDTPFNYQLKLQSRNIYTLTACPKDGYRFVRWETTSANIVKNDGTFIVPYCNSSVKAVYEAIPYAVTAITDGGGSASASAETAAVGTEIDSPDTGYHFVKWTENGREVSTSASYNFTAVADRTLAAVFEADANPSAVHRITVIQRLP
ncbi:MAG TPA: hypothetical protein PLN48_12780 [Lachnospiraceae bacterium]|nr:hypothetical protein [Lachnospiraceae bacterium]